MTLLAVLLSTSGAGGEPATDAGDEPPGAYAETPPRLALAEGDVSFWRPGAEDWAPARVNVALAAGDRLYTGTEARLEIQIGPHAFLRAAGETELGLESRAPVLRIRIGSGLATLDAGSAPSERIELDTPNAAFTIEAAGVYRFEVGGEATTVTVRQGGSATLAPLGGEPVLVASGEQVVVTGEATPHVERDVAPALDAWDRWNGERTARLASRKSAEYVSADVYGVGDLDRYGGWRTVAPYGPIWTPTTVPIGWQPFCFGRWMWDPAFRWTWVDDAPWGWAPFHHGRWVFFHGAWAWAPGAVVVHTTWAPALVAFFGAPGWSGFWWRTPAVAWVPLGWGEPCRPWWGPPGWLGQPHWLGWSGPRIVHAQRTGPRGVARVTDLRFENTRVPGALVAVPGNEFGRTSVRAIRMADVKPERLEPMRGALPVEAAPASSIGAPVSRPRSPGRMVERRVVTTEPQLAPSRPPQAAERARVPPSFGADAHAERSAREPWPRFVAPPGTIEMPRAGSGERVHPGHRTPSFTRGAPLPGTSPRGSGRVEAPGMESPMVVPRGERVGQPAHPGHHGRAEVSRGSGDATPATSASPSSGRSFGVSLPRLR